MRNHDVLVPLDSADQHQYQHREEEKPVNHIGLSECKFAHEASIVSTLLRVYDSETSSHGALKGRGLSMVKLGGEGKQRRGKTCLILQPFEKGFSKDLNL